MALSGPLVPPQPFSGAIASDSQEALLEDIKGVNVQPLWTRMAKLNPPLPEPKAIPHKFS